MTCTEEPKQIPANYGNFFHIFCYLENQVRYLVIVEHGYWVKNDIHLILTILTLLSTPGSERRDARMFAEDGPPFPQVGGLPAPGNQQGTGLPQRTGGHAHVRCRRGV